VYTGDNSNSRPLAKGTEMSGFNKFPATIHIERADTDETHKFTA